MADVWLPLATRKLEHEPFHRLLSKGGALDKARLVGITAKRDTVQLIISSQRKERLYIRIVFHYDSSVHTSTNN